jgi:anti-sigma regulatory factor (Ser/Thr protein kinase)
MRAETVVIRFALRAAPALVSVARKRAIAQLRAHGVWLDESTTTVVELVVSELVTNAVVHAQTSLFTVGLYVSDLRLTVDVHDGNHQLPRRRTAGDDSESGRGLELVAALSVSNGWATTERGKHCWAELALPELPPAVVRRRILQRPVAPRQFVGSFPPRAGGTSPERSRSDAVVRRSRVLVGR